MLTNLKPKEWKAKRDALVTELHAAGHTYFTRIVRSDVLTVSLEGSSLQIQYDMSTREVSVWGRGGSRYAGSSYEVSELIEIREAFRKWHDENFTL